MSLQWAAGLFVGEGCVTSTIPKGSGRNRYLIVTITMLDERAIRKFGEIMDMKPYSVKYRPDRPAWRCMASHRKALEVLTELLPLLVGTDKHDQAVRVLNECGYVKRSGLYALPLGRKAHAMRGNKNVAGKTWKLSDTTRQRMSEARQHREAERGTQRR